MRRDRWKLGIGILLFIGAVSGKGFVAYSDEQKQIPEHRPGPGRVFLYTAKKFGVPILKASIKIENGSSEEGKPLYRIHASVSSLQLGFLFRMNNRFLSTMQAETCSPVRYVKEIDQEGLLVEKKNYFQAFTFDFPNKKVVAERGEKKERQEIPLSSETHDPLSMLFKRRDSSRAEYSDVYFRRGEVTPDDLLFKKGEGEVEDVRRG